MEAGPGLRQSRLQFLRLGWADLQAGKKPGSRTGRLEILTEMPRAPTGYLN
jgi:hypothetical protein